MQRPPLQEKARSLAESRETLAYLAQPATGVNITDQDGLILWAGGDSLGLLGRRPEELLGTNAWDLVHPDDVRPGGELRAYLADTDMMAWGRLLHADGSTPWMRVEAFQRDGLLLIAYRREKDRSRWHVHGEPRGR